MKINIVAVGKVKEKYFESAILEYSKRITRFADFQIVEVTDAPQGKTIDEQQRIEGAKLIEKSRGYIVALDGVGKQLSSVGLAELISDKCIDGISEFSFLIGGSNGHGQTVREKADMLLSFGSMTFPHQLFRVMLVEQLYRAGAISANTPYHK